MDPVTAAGIGLSLASLSLQVFSGCIKGYQMFIDIKDMPSKYEHLRTRLRIEQSRCLHWGEKVGLVEEMLDEPSQLLRLNNNLVLDILQEIQQAFRQCVAMTSKYDPLVDTTKSTLSINGSTAPDAVEVNASLLRKTLAVWERGGRLASRIHWSMLRKESFEKLIITLIQHNDRIESLLDRNALQEVRQMQEQANLVLLQMTDQLGSLQNLVEAMQVNRGAVENINSISRASTLVENTVERDESFMSLAIFKAHYLKIETGPVAQDSLLIPFDSIQCEGESKYSGRQLAMSQGRTIWLEWRETADELLYHQDYIRQIEERVQKLASLMSASDKPVAFRSPKCIGYTRTDIDGKPRYALVHERRETAKELVPLHEMLSFPGPAPSLNVRIELATMLAASVLFLHAVDWIHKDIRSENVVFIPQPDRSIKLYEPILAGFEFSRPALPEEITNTHLYPKEEAVYRHPDLLTGRAVRSSKSHDVYSLGILLAEIAMWKPIEEIVRMELRMKTAIQVRSRMLEYKHGVESALADRAGRIFAEVVMFCVDGALIHGFTESSEEDTKVGGEMARRLHESVMLKLKSIKV